jgi:PAS domain S-box-containing protein
VARDVTDQRLAEAELRQSAQKFSAAFMNSPLVTAITTFEDDEFVEVNKMFESQTGFSRDEVIGKKGSELGIWIEPGQRLQMMGEIKAGGQVRNREARFRDRSGTVQTKLYSAELIKIDGRECLLALCQELTQRDADERLTLSQQNYRSLFLSSPCGIYRVTLEGVLVFVNDALVEMLGYESADELLSKSFVKELYADPNEERDSLDSVQQLNPLKSVEMHWKRKNGAPILVRAQARGWVSDESGQVIGLETAVEDITQQRLLDVQLRQVQKMESLALLAGGIAHDFNNVLTGVLGYGQLALKALHQTRAEVQDGMGALTEFQLRTLDKTKMQLQNIVDAAFHGQALTGQLLAFSRDESLPVYPLNLDAEIRKTEEMIGRLFGEHIRVQLQLDCEFQQILGERGAFGQVILNLCANARDAMPRGGRLAVRTFPVNVKLGGDEHVDVPCGRYVVLQVADTGCGMHKTVQRRMCEPFFTTKPTGRGSGLGLYIVYAVLRRCGGHMRVESEIGRGSTFSLYLPVLEARPIPPQAASDGVIQGRGKGLVMVVEDDDRVRDIVASQIASLGFQVVCQASAIAALQEYKKMDIGIDLLVTDIVMPELSGPELVKSLKEKQRNLKVLYMTGWAPADILQAGALGQDAQLLRKPFEERELNAKIQHLLYRSRRGLEKAKSLAASC